MMSPWRDGNETAWPKNHNVADGVDQYLVYRMVAEKSFREEGWVGWSSLTYGGTAQYANTMALYFDWTVQLHRWFEFWTAWHLGLMGQVMIAAAGMFFFLRGRSIGNLWSCCGALAYAANSQFVTWIYHRWALGSFCWVPWILWAIDLHRKGKRPGWTLVPVFICMAFLGGSLQHAALVVLVVICAWGEEAFLAGHAFIRQLKLLGRYTLWGILGAGLAAMMLIPCADALITSNGLGLHTGLFTNKETLYPKGILQPVLNLAAYPLQVFPSLLGRCASVDLLKLFRSELFYVFYFGSLPVLVAFLGILTKRTPPLARILMLVGLLLPLTPLIRQLYQRLFLLFILGGVFAFAHFMQHAERSTKQRIFKGAAIISGAGALLWTALSVLIFLKPQLTAPLKTRIVEQGVGSSFGYFGEWISVRADRFIGDLLIWSPQQGIPLLLLAAALLGLWLTCSSQHRKCLAGKALVTISLIAELTLFASRWVAWSDPAEAPLFPKTAETVALENHVGSAGRVSTVIHPSAHMAKTPFVPNTLSAYGIASIDGYDSVVPDGMVIPGEMPSDSPVLTKYGVTHLSTWAGNDGVDPFWKSVWKGRMMDLYEAEETLSRQIGFRADADMRSFFSGGSWDGDEIKEITGLENSRVLKVPAGVRWIRLAENYGSGWQFRVKTDEDWKPVTRAVDSSMLMENPHPERDTNLFMRYDPPLRRIGMAVSGFSLLILLVMPCVTGFVRAFIPARDQCVRS